MAFPTVSVTEGGLTAAGTSIAVTLPASGSASDEYLVLMDLGSTAATVNALANWTELLDENVVNGLKIIRYTGTGVPSNPTFTTSASSRTQWIAYKIAGANKSITPQIGTTATGTSLTPDPPSITPTGGVAKDYLSIVFAGMEGEEADDDTWANTPPTNYTPSPPRQKAGGTVGVNLGGLIMSAERQINTGSAIDPGTFNVDVSANWRAQHILIHPVIPTATSVARISLAAGSTPPTATNHNIKARVRKSSGSGTVTFSAALYEGATNRSGDLTTSALTTSLADYTLSIPDASAANITSYADLEIRFWANSSTGDAVNVEVAELYLQIPAIDGIETTNIAVSDRIVTGGDVFLPVEGGTGLTIRTSTGADVFNPTEAGSGISPLSAKGADVVNFVETGTGISEFVGKGSYAVSTIYLRTNTGVSSFVASAADAATFAESGSGISILISEGADIATYTESGTGVSPRIGQGSDLATFIESGLSLAVAASSGSSVETYSEDGKVVSVFTSDSTSLLVYSDTSTGLSVFVAQGSDSVIYSDAGTGLTVFSSSGSDVTTFAETGTGLTAFVASGAQTVLHQKINVALSEFYSSGESTFTAIETGTGLTEFGGTGDGELVVFGPFEYEKNGIAVSNFIGRGTDTVEFVESGKTLSQLYVSGSIQKIYQQVATALSDRIASSTDYVEKTRTATGLTEFSGSGASEYERVPQTYEKTGSGLSSFVARGSDSAEFNREGVGVIDEFYGGEAPEVVEQVSPPFGGGKGTPFTATGGPIAETVTKIFPAQITLFRSATRFVRATVELKRLSSAQFSANIELRRTKAQTFNLEREPAEHYLSLRRDDEELLTILYF